MSTRTIRTLTALLVAGIAALAFLVSFEAISGYAVRVGAFPSSLAWCAPLLVDTFTVAACLVILARSRDGVRAVYAWSLVALASAVSVALNIAHAPPHMAARLVAALPPAALLAALELVMSEARRGRDRAESEQSSVDTAQARTSRAVVRELVAADTHVDVDQVVTATGVGRRRAYELLRSVRAEGNGQHPESGQVEIGCGVFLALVVVVGAVVVLALVSLGQVLLSVLGLGG